MLLNNHYYYWLLSLFNKFDSEKFNSRHHCHPASVFTMYLKKKKRWKSPYYSYYSLLFLAIWKRRSTLIVLAVANAILFLTIHHGWHVDKNKRRSTQDKHCCVNIFDSYSKKKKIYQYTIIGQHGDTNCWVTFFGVKHFWFTIFSWKLL